MNSKKEKMFNNKISQIMKEHKQKEENKIFDKWVNKHNDDLKMVYDDCINSEITYEDFKRLAYMCSEKCSC